MQFYGYDDVFFGALQMCKPVRPSGVQQMPVSIGQNRWRVCFVTPRQVAVLPRHPPAKTRQVGFVVVAQLGDFNQTDMGDSLRRVQVKQDFINELAAKASVLDGQIFEVNQPLQVDAHLRQTPAASVAQLPAAKSGGSFRAAFFAFGFHQLADVREQEARLRRQFIERASEHFRREFVRQRDVIERDFDKAGGACTRLPCGQRFDFPLVLVKQRDGVNERQIFFVVAPVARARRGKGQCRRERIDDVERLQQPLRVAELFQQVFPFLVRNQARQRAALALHAMNASGLLGALVHRQRQTTVLQLLVQVNGRGRQKNHHRAFNVIFLRHPKVNLVRYADDFIITGATKELLENEVKPLVEQFLRDRGLQLSPEKTCVTHIEQGFDFLGMHVRKYDGKLLIKPSKKNMHAFLEKVRATIRRNRAVEQKFLIKMLNPVIRGWTNYHRHITAAQAFRKAEMVIWQRLWYWAKRRHSEKSVNWIAKRYWHRLGRIRRTFAADSGERTPDGKPKLFRLVDPTETRIRRFVKVKAEANPFDPRWRDYFEDRAFFKRMGIHRHEAGIKPS